MKKPTFFKPFLFVLISSVALASMPKLTFAQRGGGGLRGGGGFRSGSVGGFRGGFRGGAPAHMGGVPSWHPGGSGFAPRGPAFSRRDIGGGRAGVARPKTPTDRPCDSNDRCKTPTDRPCDSNDRCKTPTDRRARISNVICKAATLARRQVLVQRVLERCIPPVPTIGAHQQ